MALSRLARTSIVVLIVVVALAIAATIAVATLVPMSSDTARTRLIAALEKRFDAEVELAELHVRALPSLHAEGAGLTIRHRGRRDLPPLISIARFSAEGSVANLLHHRVSRLALEGLDIEIPPDRNRDADRDKGDKNAEKESAEKDDALPEGPHDSARTLIIDQLTSTGARLAIIPDEAGKSPRVWEIHDLDMHSVSSDHAMPFEATLTNAVPPGEIHTRGSFGPWHSDEPGHTPLDGVFTFDHADLGVFKGISGILSAHGSFGGHLARLDVHGETETPDFTVQTGGHPVALHTKYHAIVDGTNGNTVLEEVNASFLNTAIVAKGGVIESPRKDGRTVTLDVSITHGRLEDILKLAVTTPKAPMTGALQMTTKFVLPPGDRDVVKKLRLNGRFSIDNTRFTDQDVQRKIVELSRRSRGKLDETEEAPRMATRFTGTFKLGSATLEIPKVSFNVPGSLVELRGTYALLAEELDFRGMLFMDVKVSQTTTGFKSLLLKLADPLFKREGGGSAIPIRISGKRSDPSFGLDKGRVFSRKKS